MAHPAEDKTSEARRAVPRIFLYALLAFLFVIPFVHVSILHNVAMVPQFAFVGIGSLVLLFILIASIAKTSLKITWHPVLFSFGLWIVWASLSYFWSVDPRNTIVEILQLLSAGLLLFFGLQISRNDAALLKVMYALGLSAGLVSIIGILQAYDLNLLSLTQHKKPSATFGNRNIAAQYVELIVPLILTSLLLCSGKRTLSWILSICLAASVIYLVYTRSRGAWVGVTAAIFLYGYLLLRSQLLRLMFVTHIKKHTVQLISIIVLTVPMSILHFQIEAPSKKLSTPVDSSAEARLNAYPNALAMITDKPFAGFGQGSFMLAYRPYMFSITPLETAHETRYMVNLHNDILQTFAELGIPGGMLLLAILYLFFREILRAYSSAERHLSLLAIGTLTAIVASLVHGLVSFPLQMPASSTVFWLLVGIGCGFGIRHSRKKEKSMERWWTNTLIPLTVLLLVINSATYYESLFHSYKIKQLETTLRAKDCDRVRKLLSNIDPMASYESKIIVPIAYRDCPPDSEQTLTAMNEIINYDPNHAMARLLRGDQYLQRNRLDLAKEDFVRVVEILPHRPSGYVGLGHVALKRGNRQLAQNLYKTAIEIAPENEKLRDSLISILERTK